MEQEFIDKFNTLNKAKKTPQLLQQRGRDFEDLINDIFLHEEVLLRKGFHTSDNKSEQIDGAIEIDNRIFLVETKWVNSNLAASELFAFIGKIENKFFGTLGIFISKEKLSENFINALNKGRRQVVLVIHGEDIKLLFDPTSKIKIKDYISHTLRMCSYDNILHFPVKKYLDLMKNTSLQKEDNHNEAIQFIKTNLWKTPISETDLLTKINKNTKVLNNQIFERIITIYSDIYNASLTKLNFDFTIIENFNKFIKVFDTDTKILEKTAKEYYQKLIFKDFAIYHRPLFSITFSEYYLSISIEKRNEIEDKLVENLNKAFKESNWNLENYITDTIRPIWENINKKEDFYNVYLSIYLRDTLDKFSQKKFANDLIIAGEISKEFTEDWLKEKIINIYNEYNKTVEDSDVKFVARTYILLNKILKTDNWLIYVGDMFDKVKLEEN